VLSGSSASARNWRRRAETDVRVFFQTRKL
jgi:hypothetical protein